MNKIIPFTNSIILYFLFPFYFFYFKIFKIEKNFSIPCVYFYPTLSEIRALPIHMMRVLSRFFQCHSLHFFQNFPLHFYASPINDFYNLVRLSKFPVEHMLCEYMFCHISPTDSFNFFIILLHLEQYVYFGIVL